MEDRKVIEINGVKLEVDMRTATRVDLFRVGSKVKLLKKDNYGSPSIWPGVVVGFEPFESLPTIIVAYVEHGYSSVELNFANINASAKSKEAYELVMSIDDTLPVDKADVLEVFNRKRSTLESEIEVINQKESYFLRHFGQYFKNEEAETVD